MTWIILCSDKTTELIARKADNYHIPPPPRPAKAKTRMLEMLMLIYMTDITDILYAVARYVTTALH